MIELRRDHQPTYSTAVIAPSAVLTLAGDCQSARLARQFVREYIACHVPGASTDHVDRVTLVVSELVTNSIRYGTEPGDSLRLVLDADGGRTRVEVHDPVRRRPRTRPESGVRTRGRGLLVLDALCPGTWGVDNIPLGKSVWAEVPA
ncbi:anti-sigma regulatory factor [Streptomyces chrestomyceticus JCM 4735]|uniref:Anti-sigma regulatory factor n=1 Tax=Streptomyces chrestomyceticus JCM 4735 TaxID=1306181 RepID=A0A7U9KX17_9ACTN|nr:ATP-binding protein [Streptomyces chrestomyceticus]GCD36960.1 anti-sigma regulatory factor [Streptomyces chrestomyceticus JCM 4735]